MTVDSRPRNFLKPKLYHRATVANNFLTKLFACEKDWWPALWIRFSDPRGFASRDGKYNI
jgi:hypothetical protein